MSGIFAAPGQLPCPLGPKIFPLCPDPELPFPQEARGQKAAFFLSQLENIHITVQFALSVFSLRVTATSWNDGSMTTGFQGLVRRGMR